ncbi:MAG: glycoside hydrolase family 3 C-terminal domain-containing protein [Lactovum sp.]
MRNIEEILNKLSVEEKAELCCGAGFWNSTGLKKYGIPEMNLTDGPHGVRKQKGATDHLGLNESDKTTCFPTAAGLASSWNPNLIYKVGQAIGQEAQSMDVQVVLGPGANIKRSPLCGRNFEYYSEDPYLTGELAIAHIKGIQSKGVGTSLKHFAVNNQETHRFNINAVVDERSLREIYLTGFEKAVKEAQPWTVMSAYNQINAEYCSQNKKLLKDILKDDWRFEGVVVSDWFATCNRGLGLEAGLDLEMPTSAGIGVKAILDGIENESVSMEALNDSARRMLNVIFKSVDGKVEEARFDIEAHHQLSKEAALESMVLLKNEGNILPISRSSKVAIVGDFAKEFRFQGAGSSRINTTKVDIPYDEIIKMTPNAEFTSPEEADICLVFVGLSDKDDSEGKDRRHLRLPKEQNALITETLKVNKNIVVILMNGSAVEMPWINEVKAIFECYLGGQAMAGALADLLFGNVNPSGKIAETFPVQLKDTPSYINFPGDKNKVEYREGLFVGYRYYEKAEVKVLFPFGHGLSYTSFEYSDISVSKEHILDTETVDLTLKLKNTGLVEGKEIVQLYVKELNPSVLRPIKELKGFKKINLNSTEEKLVTFTLDKRSFAFYDEEINDWRVESGNFEILVGKSSAEIEQSIIIFVESTTKVKKNYNLDSTLFDIMDEELAKPLIGMMMSGGNGGTALGMEMESVLSSIKIRSLVPMSKMKAGSQSLELAQLEALIEEMNK